MTNPNNALGTNAALGGRTSVDAFNDAISSLTRGVVSGFAVTPSSAMTLNVGGTAGVRDVAVAVSPNGNRVSVDNRTTSPIKVTMAAASASSARIDAIVAYVNSPSQVTVTTPDNPTACGIIPVSGTASAQPTDSAIRTAISADGGTGSTAYYVIIAIVRLAANTTTITSNMITMQKSRIADSLVTNDSIADKVITSDKVDFTTLLPQLFKTYEMPTAGPYTPGTAWTNYNMGDPLTVNGLDPNATYTIIASTPYSEGKGEFRLSVTGATSYRQDPYNSTGVLVNMGYQIQGVKPTSSGSLTFQRAYSGEITSIRTAKLYITLIRTA